MSKPTNLALWSTTGTKVEPSTGVKQAGWAPNQRPPAQWLNWWMNAVYLWMVWLDAFESTIHSWSAKQTFAAAVEFSDVAANVVFDHGFTANGTSTFDSMLIGGTLGVTGNAAFHGITTIDALVANGPAVFEGAVTFDGVAVSGGSGTWTMAGVMDFGGIVNFTMANPARTDPVMNNQTGLNTNKAWGSFQLNNTTTDRCTEGVNIASVVQDLGSALITVTFAQPMANIEYSVVTQVNGSTTAGFFFDLFDTGTGDARTVNGFTGKIAKMSALSSYPAASAVSGVKCMFQVFARQ